ncbi:MAG: hypothetical protein ACLFPS_05900 [Clostridia bacterium]
MVKNKIKEVLIDGERINLKKSNLGWKVVHPIKNPDGSINWKNLITGGSWWNLLIVAFLVIIILSAINEYYSNVKLASACLRALPDSINLGLYLDNPNLINNFTLIP